MFTVSSLTKSWTHLRVLDDVSLTGAEGTVTALVGPSGSGKSTLMNHLVGSDEAAERLRGCVPSRSCTHAWQRRAAGWDLLLHALAARQ